MNSKYDVLELKYNDGSPAVLRHTDGSGFAYYQSGRKCICVSAHGWDGRGKPRRFAAVIHGDGPRGQVVGAFDDKGHGYADGQPGSGDAQPPKLLITDKGVSTVDGQGRASEAAFGATAISGTGSHETTWRMNAAVTLKHRLGRTTLDFQCGGVNHVITIGELQGDDIAGMPMAAPSSLAQETTMLLGENAQRLAGVRSKMAALTVDPSQRDTKPAVTVDTKNFKDVLDNLATLQQSLTHPNLAKDLEWNTELKLKKLLAATHPQCPGHKEHQNWSISRFGGKCTEERLVNAKPTVPTPKSITLISALKLPELIDEYSSKGTLLVVICLANYALDQSNYAKLLVERAHAELWKRFCGGADRGPPPVRLVAVEMTEIGSFAEEYGVKEVPYCLMFQNGHAVYSKRLRGMRTLPKDVQLPRFRILVVEPSPAQQLKLERNVRRNGFESDLGFDGPHALRLASRQQAYGALLVSTLIRTDQLRPVVAAVRQSDPNALILAFNAGVQCQDEPPETRKRFLDECSYVYPFVPSYTGLATVLARYRASPKAASPAGKDHARDFVEEVQKVMGRTAAPSLGTTIAAGGGLG
mmetsp:Transcript_38879/g.109860  ORF Transcript_38879/g.109860 Transcript_38879/m.109860 type:complete len:584 (-) Transcript_38879:112-1863(-)